MNANDIDTLRNSAEIERASKDVQYWLHSILHLQAAYVGPSDISCLADGSAEAQEYQRVFADVFGIPLEVMTPRLGIRMRLVPPGTFLMGSPFCEKGRLDHEGPQHEVTITKPAYVATTPITVRTFVDAACNDEGGDSFAERFLGYGGVSQLRKADMLDRAHEFRGETIKPFIQRLDFMEGFPTSKPFFRLPTEAEWEYSCRAGTLTPFYGGVSMDTVGWYGDNTPQDSPGAYRIPGHKAPNAFGLYDMHGLIDEICEDKYHPLYYLKSPAEDPFSAAGYRKYSGTRVNNRRERATDYVLRGWGGYPGGGKDVTCRSASRAMGSMGGIRPVIAIDRFPPTALQPFLRFQRRLFDASLASFRSKTGNLNSKAREDLVADIRKSDETATTAYQWLGVADRWIRQAYDEMEAARALRCVEGAATTAHEWGACGQLWLLLGAREKAVTCAQKSSEFAATVREFSDCADGLAEMDALEEARQCAESAMKVAVTSEDWIMCADTTVEYCPDREVLARCVKRAEQRAKTPSDYFDAANRYEHFLGDNGAAERCRKKAMNFRSGIRRWWPFRD